jgi:hypothetical protein
MTMMPTPNKKTTMKTPYKLGVLAIVALGLTIGSTKGALFDYSFTYTNGNVVSGTLEGTVSSDGNYVDNVQNVTVLYNGIPMSGSIYTATLSFPPGSQSGTYVAGPVVAFNALSNDFWFGNSNVLSGNNFSSDYFYIINDMTEAVQNYSAFGVENYGTANSYTLTMWGVWSLTDVTSLQPTVTIKSLGPEHFVFSWPTNFTGFTLKYTTQFSSPAIWTPVSAGPVVVNGQNVVTNPVSGTQQFFRLFK